MRRNDIEKKILEAYKKAPLPDTLDETREKVLSAEPLPQEERRKALRWKVLAPALAGGAAAIALLIALPFALQGEGKPDVSGSSSIPPVLTTLDEKEAGAFARQALSLVTLAEEEERSSLLMRQPLTEQDFRRIAGEIDGYIEMVEEFQRTDGLSISLLAGDTLIQVEDGELSLVIDYEEEKVSEELQRFSGTIESGEESYRFEGRVEEKGEEKEVETILYLPDGSWIESEQEIEQGENEYSYAYYEKGATRPWREVEFEKRDPDPRRRDHYLLLLRVPGRGDGGPLLRRVRDGVPLGGGGGGQLPRGEAGERAPLHLRRGGRRASHRND